MTIYQLTNPARTLLTFGILPVVLIDFTANEINGKVVLKWSTAQELNSQRFEVERSTDGTIFEKIASVAAAGNSSARKDYLFADNTIFEGRYTYRLKQVDIDGKFIYSRAVSIILKNSGIFHLLENPAKNQLRLVVNGDARQPFAIRIFDMAGKTVLRQTMKNQNRISIDISSLNEGIYIVEVIADGKSAGVQLMKMN